MLSNDHIEQLPFPLNVVATKTNVSVMIVDGVKCVGIADMYFVDDHWWLARLNVHRDYRQNGYGKRLIEALKEHAREFYILVAPGGYDIPREEQYAFYTACGFITQSNETMTLDTQF